MILFIHVPKTGGSSFRAALDRAYGSDFVALDYGKESPETSTMVQKHIYREISEKPRRKLLSRLRKNQYKALAGHFYYRKYAYFFPAEDVVSFMREPLGRAASEFLHKKRLNGYNETFETFIEQRGNQNPQSAYLNGLPVASFVGITELYRESLQLLNRQRGTDFRVGRHNVAPGGGAKKFVKSIPPAIIRRFLALNQRDVLLYEDRRSAFLASYQRQFNKAL